MSGAFAVEHPGCLISVDQLSELVEVDERWNVLVDEFVQFDLQRLDHGYPTL